MVRFPEESHRNQDVRKVVAGNGVVFHPRDRALYPIELIF